MLVDRELEDQYIYCARPEGLNDPMEGLRDVVWQGDHILWTNFFKHYLRSLQVFGLIFEFVGHARLLTDDDIQVGYSLRWLLDREPLTTAMYERLAEHSDLSSLITGVVDRELRYDELLFTLRHFHHDAIEVMKSDVLGFSTAIGLVTATPRQDIPAVLEHLDDQALHLKRTTLRPQTAYDYNRNMLMIDYPKRYLQRLQSLLYFDWYAACFAGAAGNSSLWSHYGDRHRGACLIYDSLSTERGTLKAVKYTSQPPPVYFFQEMGTLTKEELLKTWYQDPQGNTSAYARHLGEDEIDQWRKRRVDNLFEGISWKSSDWEHEQESRLILVDVLKDRYADPGERRIRYSFTDLAGIAFGIRMDERDKIAVMDIVEQKCHQHQRTDFLYYQAFFSPQDGRIGMRQI